MVDETQRRRPPLSVVISTVQGWPEVRLPLDILRPQLARMNGEVVVMDGSGRPVPEAAEIGRSVRWLTRPGVSVFDLRRLGLDEADGDIVAFTEDHCEPAADWCRLILEAHAEHPDVATIGGAVENASTGRMTDRATFLVTQAPFIPPIAPDDTQRMPGITNISYKRAALRQLHSAGDDPLRFLNIRVQAHGPMRIDDRIRVAHHQSMGVRGTAAINYHNGRAIGGTRRRRMGRGDWLRMAAASLLPLYRSARTIRMAQRKGRLGEALPLLPVIVWLQCWTAAGELVGYALGPGDSPRKLH